MSNAVDDVVSQHEEQKDREVEEHEDALSTTDELVVDDLRQDDSLLGNVVRSPLQMSDSKCELSSSKPFWATLEGPAWLYPGFVKDEAHHPWFKYARNRLLPNYPRKKSPGEMGDVIWGLMHQDIRNVPRLHRGVIFEFLYRMQAAGMQGSHILQYLTAVAEYGENNEFYWPSKCNRMQVLLWLTSAETIYEAEELMIEALRLLYKCRVERIPVGKALIRIDFWEWVTEKTRDFLTRRG
jgi:hypothetical protein